MKRGFIQPGKTAAELIRIFKHLEESDVIADNITINSSFDEFVKNVNDGDTVVIDSYIDIFGGLNDMLMRLIELSQRGVIIESFNEPLLKLTANNIDIFKALLSIGIKVKASSTVRGLNKARESGVKLGRPLGTTKADKKVKDANRLHREQGLSITKACKIVGCQPRTYYRHIKNSSN